MKYCNKCNKVYDDTKTFCPVCGSRLDFPQRTDIFGEYMDQNIFDKHKQVKPNESTNKDYCIYLDNDPKHLNTEIIKIWSIISIVCSLVPVIGTLVIIFGLSNSIKFYNLKLTEKKYLIINLIALILNIIWFIILVYFKVLDFSSALQG